MSAGNVPSGHQFSSMMSLGSLYNLATVGNGCSGILESDMLTLMSVSVYRLVVAVSWIGVPFRSMIRLLFLSLMITWTEITICRRLSSPLSYLHSNILVRRPFFKMTTPDLIVQELLQTFLGNTMSAGWIGHRIRQIWTPFSMRVTSWDVDFKVTMPHPPIMHNGPYACGRLAGNTTGFLSKTGKHRETGVLSTSMAEEVTLLLGAHETLWFSVWTVRDFIHDHCEWNAFLK